MTDITEHQSAVIAVVGETPRAAGGSVAQQVTVIALCGETPRTAGGAILSQTVAIALVRDYAIPAIYIPVPLGKHLATYPYWVGQYEDDYS